MATTIKKQEEIREILARACARRELLILATPYLRFESSFVSLVDEELHVLATMSREDAVFGLRTPELKIRFPQDMGFFEAPVQMVGLGLVEGRRTVRLSIPKSLTENDQRVAFRVEHVGRVTVTFSSQKNNIYLGSLVDISTSGARLHAQQDLAPEEFRAGDGVMVTVPLSGEIYINTHATVRHTRPRDLGVQFTPPLAPVLLEPLSRWVFQRREEERERMARRLELNRQAAPPAGHGLPQAGILLVSSDPQLEEALAPALQGIQPLERIPPAAQVLKEAMGRRPSLALFHVNGPGLDERRRMKTLAEQVSGKFPVLLLGTQVDGSTLFELSSEWKASSAMVWSPARAAFLQRLVQGILRRHSDGGESPMAPVEEQP